MRAEPVASLALLPMVPLLARKKARAQKRKSAMKSVLIAFEMEHPELRIRRDTATGNLIFEAHPRVLYD